MFCEAFCLGDTTHPFEMKGMFFFMSIQLNQVNYSIGERTLIEISNLALPSQGVIGIVGKNGSGKTTLLKLIAGELPLDEGHITYSGEIETIQQFLDNESHKSGGEQTKERIQRSFHSAASILLADEPTNHLDENGRQYLMKEMQHFRGLILVVSHDRDFLNQVCEKIIEIEDSVVTLYPGNYDDYLQQKEVVLTEQQSKYDSYVKEKARLEGAISELHQKSAGIRKAPRRMGNSEARLHKRGKGQTAKKAISQQALGIETRLDKLEKVEKRKESKPLVIPFLQGQVIHRKVLIEGEQFSLKAGEKVLLEKTNFKMLTGPKTGIIGENGVGKTSLLQAILRGDSGLKIAQKAKFTYFSQSFNQLAEEKSVLENVEATSIYEPQASRDLLAHLLFRGDTVNKPVEVPSGGERTKVAIAKMILSDNNVLILDEPTNHLDIESLEVLEEALVAYKGSVIFVSHDPYFMKQVADDILKIENKTIVNLKETKVEKAPQGKKVDKMVLEMRKTSLLSQLSLPLGEAEKLSLETEFQEVLKALKEC